MRLRRVNTGWRRSDRRSKGRALVNCTSLLKLRFGCSLVPRSPVGVTAILLLQRTLWHVCVSSMCWCQNTVTILVFNDSCFPLLVLHVCIRGIWLDVCSWYLVAHVNSLYLVARVYSWYLVARMYLCYLIVCVYSWYLGSEIFINGTPLCTQYPLR